MNHFMRALRFLACYYISIVTKSKMDCLRRSETEAVLEWKLAETPFLVKRAADSFIWLRAFSCLAALRTVIRWQDCVILLSDSLSLHCSETNHG